VEQIGTNQTYKTFSGAAAQGEPCHPDSCGF